MFIEKWNEIAKHVHEIAKTKGWWETDRNDGEMISLMHSELSEVIEALRKNNPASNHIPIFSSVEEELADVVIRIMDYSTKRKFNVGEAIIAKINFNKTRSYKHGNKKF